MNSHDQSLITCENEERSNLEIVPNNSHFQTNNHNYDFGIQEIIPIYDLYDDQDRISIQSHTPLSNSQMGINNHSNYIIMPNSCEDEIVLNQSQLCCNNNCNTSVNHGSILLFYHLFLTSDLFSIFNLIFLDTLC